MLEPNLVSETSDNASRGVWKNAGHEKAVLQDIIPLPVIDGI
jgi:hypothetical protein